MKEKVNWTFHWQNIFRDMHSTDWTWKPLVQEEILTWLAWSQFLIRNFQPFIISSNYFAAFMVKSLTLSSIWLWYSPTIIHIFGCKPLHALLRHIYMSQIPIWNRDNPVLDPLAVLNLNNRLYIDLIIYFTIINIVYIKNKIWLKKPNSNGYRYVYHLLGKIIRTLSIH